MEARKSIQLQLKQNDFDKFSNKISSLSINDFDEASEILKNNSNGKINPIIFELLNKVQSATAKVQGSKAALKHRRNDIRSYIIYYGAPHFFITINPVDIHSPILLKIGGVDIIPELLSRNNYFRVAYLKKNPYIQAIYCDIIIKNFIKFLLCFDKNLNEKKTGIIGLIDAYYGCVETQDRGSLHLHFLIWVTHGLSPNEYYDKLKIINFKNKLISFLNNIIHCDFDGLIQNQINNDNDSNIHPCCKSIDYITNDLNNTENLNLFLNDVYEVAKESVIHKCSFSCYKYNKSNDQACRHNYGYNNQGKQLIKETTIDKNGKIKLKRNHSHVNEFNWFIMAGLRCNHDIKFVSTSKNESLAIIYYLTNYITKNGLSTYNNMLFSTLAMKKVDQYHNYETNKNEKTKKLLSACYNAAANNTEYSGAYVANMLLKNGNDGTYYSSHLTKCLNIFPILKKISSIDNYNNMISIDNLFKKDETEINKMIYDYINRPTELIKTVLYEFVSNYIKIKMESNITTQNNSNFYRLNENHKQKHSHVIKKEKYVKIPMLLCPSIPRQNDDNNKQLYKKIITILFKPWNSINQLTELCNNNDSTKQLLNSMPNNIKRYVDNIECLKKSINDANEEKLVKNLNSNKSNNNINLNNIDETSDEESETYELIKSNPELLNVINERKDEKWTSEAINILKNDVNINSNNTNSNKFIIKFDHIEKSKIENWKKQINNANDEELDLADLNDLFDNDNNNYEENNSNLLIDNNTLTNEVVELINKSITDIIKQYKLNFKQQKAFKLFIDPVINNSLPQRIIYLGGEGGTGKSQVIHAITEFFKINNISQKLVKSAPTGSASSLINGKLLFIQFN